MLNERFALVSDNAALVIVDIQERLAAVMKKRQKVIDNCLHLIEAARLLEIPVLLTEQYPKGLGPTVGEIRNALPESPPIEKLDFSCCGEPAFMQAIRDTGRKKIILAGMETHVCVLQTCQGLLEAGYDVHFVRDAVCSRHKNNYVSGIQLARDSGAVVTSTEIVLFQLLKKAGTETFRLISKRIK